MRGRLDNIRNLAERYVHNSWAMEQIIDEVEELRKEIAELEKIQATIKKARQGGFTSTIEKLRRARAKNKPNMYKLDRTIDPEAGTVTWSPPKKRRDDGRSTG